MHDLTAFVGGSIGSDPYSPRTWSGSAAFLFREMSEAGILDKAIGIDLPKSQKYWLLAKNFSRNRAVWRKHFYFDPAYRRALTRSAARMPVSEFLLQIGTMFSLPDAFPGRKCLSYHDGSLAELQKSGFGLQAISPKRIAQALEYERTVSQRMAAVFTFSEYLRQSFITDYGCRPERVFNIGGAVNLSSVPSPVENKSYDVPRILFIGVEFARKGGPLLLDAFKAVRETVPAAELHIVGPTSIGDVPPGVTFHGHLSKGDPAQAATLQNLFHSASLFALPSLYEPFGIAPLEAMLYQLPCVVTDAWALRETVSPGFNGELVQKGSVEDLVAKLRSMLSDPGRLATMGLNGRNMVLERYTWSAVVRRMADALHQLAGNPVQSDS